MKTMDLKVLSDGTAAHSFQTLLKMLSSIVSDACRVPGARKDSGNGFQQSAEFTVGTARS